jgi:hypothetical protein
MNTKTMALGVLCLLWHLVCSVCLCVLRTRECQATWVQKPRSPCVRTTCSESGTREWCRSSCVRTTAVSPAGPSLLPCCVLLPHASTPCQLPRGICRSLTRLPVHATYNVGIRTCTVSTPSVTHYVFVPLWWKKDSATRYVRRFFGCTVILVLSVL